MKETDIFICEWCNREIKEVENEAMHSLDIIASQAPNSITMINWMHEKCVSLAIPAINRFIEDERIKNDCDENFNPYN